MGKKQDENQKSVLCFWTKMGEIAELPVLQTIQWLKAINKNAVLHVFFIFINVLFFSVFLIISLSPLLILHVHMKCTHVHPLFEDFQTQSLHGWHELSPFDISHTGYEYYFYPHTSDFKMTIKEYVIEFNTCFSQEEDGKIKKTKALQRENSEEVWL